MPRKAKLIIYIPDQKKVHQIFIPASSVPRLKYHGIDPEHIAGLEIDVYMATGNETDQGFEMKYHHTVFPKLQTRQVAGG
jgi:hypothetical protein